MTLTEFLLARIAEDEADALELHYYGDCDLARHAINDPGYGWECTCGYPDRVRAECEAKRRIVEREAERLCEQWRRRVDEHRQTFDEWLVPPYGETLRDLAAVYADHPDYDEAWRP